MTPNPVSAKVGALRELYADNKHAAAILNDFANRSNNQSITKVEQIMSRLGSSEVPRWAVVKLFRGLNGLEFGRFVEGRRGHSSRFLWAVNLIDVGKAAQGENLKISTPAIDEHRSEMVTHFFNLRSETVIKIELPEDFTEKEAERLSTFVRSLPL